ncbi:molybdopterin-guanine dinucleotide biosynthesis protein B [Paenibacillus sp. P26]|nr:molybdopterin-guanine dinucleotide biosynthesis protein B [Paenibacillus sp. P26]UUZ93902.1 molybdopterin-guanine dinucleotide biosynthesis protein B [Paenibacillus sp. P25]
MTNAIGFAGFSGSGKTTLISRLTARFGEQGIRVAVIKHDAHGHYKEVPGTDSALFAASGASAVVVISPEEALIRERERVSLEQMLERLDHRYDLILIEGFKQGSHDQIAVFRTEEQAEILSAVPRPPVACAVGDLPHAESSGGVPVYSIDDIEGLARFIAERFHLDFT